MRPRKGFSAVVVATASLFVCNHDARISPELSRQAAQPPSVERIELSGGPTVVFVEIPGTGRVAVQAMYDVGIIDEPAGIPQAAHLVEHLVSLGATAKSAAGESFAKLNQFGMTNAETLPSLTHYDYGIPADRLDLALSTEAERLRSLSIEEKVVAQEAARCYQEVQVVASLTPPALGKFALMAATQWWFHSRQSAQVLGGLESAPLADLRAFHSRHYNKSNLTLIVVGSVSRDAVLALVIKHFEGLPSPTAPAGRFVWPKLPRQGEVEWDAPATIVYFAFPPPEILEEQLIMTATLESMAMRLYADPDVKRVASRVDASNRVWPVGRCPGFVAFTLVPGASKDEAVSNLSARIRTTIGELNGSTLAGSLPGIVSIPFSLDAAPLKSSAEAMSERFGSVERAYDVVLGNAAIQIGLREVWLGPAKDAVLLRAQEMVKVGFADFIERRFSEKAMVVTTLVPRAH